MKSEPVDRFLRCQAALDLTMDPLFLLSDILVPISAKTLRQAIPDESISVMHWDIALAGRSDFEHRIKSYCAGEILHLDESPVFDTVISHLESHLCDPKFCANILSSQSFREAFLKYQFAAPPKFWPKSKAPLDSADGVAGIEQVFETSKISSSVETTSIRCIRTNEWSSGWRSLLATRYTQRATR